MEVSGCLVTLFGDYGMKKQFGVQEDPLWKKYKGKVWVAISLRGSFRFAFGLGL